MASQSLFDRSPPFPEDVTTAKIHTISLEGLTSGDVSTSRRLLQSCRELGFFLLDLRNDTLGKLVIDEIDNLFETGQCIMDLPYEVKQKFLHDPPKSFLGFKPRGIAKTETNEPDRFEWFNIGQDGLLGNAPLQPLPSLVHSHLKLFTSFLNHGQRIAHMINESLAAQLGMPPDTFTVRQTPTQPSGTVVRLIKSYASHEDCDYRTSMIHHTDFGTITLLANVVGGLQVLAPGKEATDDQAWLYVRPRPGCLIVNLGDAMVQWTGGLLRSNCHRINHAPGEQRFVDRYSLAILVRPQRNASMRNLLGEDEVGEGEELTAWEWEVKKMMALKRGELVVESNGGQDLAVAEHDTRD